MQDVGTTRSYDLHVTHGGEQRRIEVKGSSGEAVTVELATAEVTNARDHQHTDLDIVDGISWARQADGSITTHRGHERVIHDWTPAEGNLAPTRFRYTIH